MIRLLNQLDRSEPLPNLPRPIKIAKKNNLDLRSYFGSYFFKIWKKFVLHLRRKKNQSSIIIKTEIRILQQQNFVLVILLVSKFQGFAEQKFKNFSIKNRTSYPSVVIIEVVIFFFNLPPTPIMFVQENQQLYHYFFLPSLTWRTPFLTVPAVHPKLKQLL